MAYVYLDHAAVVWEHIRIQSDARNSVFFTNDQATKHPAFADQIPFLELVEAQEVKKVRYKLLGGTPFAKTNIDEVREMNLTIRRMCSRIR